MRASRPSSRLALLNITLLALASCLTALVACGDDSDGSGDGDGATTSNATASSNTSATTGGTTGSTGGGTTGGATGGTTGGSTGDGTYSCEYAPTGDFTPDAVDQCDLFAQDCSDGQACFLTADGAQCYDPGMSSCGEPCEFLNDCQPGQICAGAPSRCLAMCEPGSACPGAAQCAALSDRADVGVCVPTEPGQPCDLQAQDCEGGEACYLINGSPECAPPTADAVGAGERCAVANGCQPGLICVGVDIDNLSCRRPCAASEAAGCGDGEVCQPLAEGGDDGVCVDGE